MRIDFLLVHITYHGGEDDGRDGANQAEPSKEQTAQYGQDNGECEIVVTNGATTSGCTCGWLLYNGHSCLYIWKEKEFLISLW